MKRNIYIHITESLCCTEEINIVNQLYFNKIKTATKPKKSLTSGLKDSGANLTSSHRSNRDSLNINKKNN